MIVDTGTAMTLARQRLGMTQAELARALGLAEQNGRNTISRLEKGATLPGVYRLALELLLERNRNGK